MGIISSFRCCNLFLTILSTFLTQRALSWMRQEATGIRSKLCMETMLYRGLCLAISTSSSQLGESQGNFRMILAKKSLNLLHIRYCRQIHRVSLRKDAQK